MYRFKLDRVKVSWKWWVFIGVFIGSILLLNVNHFNRQIETTTYSINMNSIRSLRALTSESAHEMIAPRLNKKPRRGKPKKKSKKKMEESSQSVSNMTEKIKMRVERFVKYSFHYNYFNRKYYKFMYPQPSKDEKGIARLYLRKYRESTVFEPNQPIILGEKRTLPYIRFLHIPKTGTTFAYTALHYCCQQLQDITLDIFTANIRHHVWKFDLTCRQCLFQPVTMNGDYFGHVPYLPIFPPPVYEATIEEIYANPDDAESALRKETKQKENKQKELEKKEKAHRQPPSIPLSVESMEIMIDKVHQAQVRQHAKEIAQETQSFLHSGDPSYHHKQQQPELPEERTGKQSANTFDFEAFQRSARARKRTKRQLQQVSPENTKLTQKVPSEASRQLYGVLSSLSSDVSATLPMIELDPSKVDTSTITATTRLTTNFLNATITGEHRIPYLATFLRHPTTRVASQMNFMMNILSLIDTFGISHYEENFIIKKIIQRKFEVLPHYLFTVLRPVLVTAVIQQQTFSAASASSGASSGASSASSFADGTAIVEQIASVEESEQLASILSEEDKIDTKFYPEKFHPFLLRLQTCLQAIPEQRRRRRRKRNVQQQEMLEDDDHDMVNGGKSMEIEQCRWALLADYPGFKGCQTKMILGYSCMEHRVQITPEHVSLAKQRLLYEFTFLGITEHWNASIALFHKQHGGDTYPEEFFVTRQGAYAQNNVEMDGKHMTPLVVLQEMNFHDTVDEELYHYALTLFYDRLGKYGIEK